MIEPVKCRIRGMIGHYIVGCQSFEHILNPKRYGLKTGSIPFPKIG